MSGSIAKKFIRPAILEHIRHWWGGDGLLHRKIIRADRTICPKTVRDIANAYGVSRGLRGGCETEVAKLLDARLVDWPDTLITRSAFVRRVAVEAEEQSLTKGILLSAFSKIVWFAKPDGWTLYDSFARRSLQYSPRAFGADDYERYYNRLSELEFDNAMKVGRNVLSKHDFGYLWPERILDKYLMYLGHVPSRGLRVVGTEAHETLLELWVQFHGEDMTSKIDLLVDEFTSELGRQPAFQVHTLINTCQMTLPPTPPPA